MKSKTLYVSQAAIIAALYVALTIISPNPIGVFQVRFSEALTILPVFMPAAVPGLFIGCVLANLISGAVIWDIVFGSLATLVAAYLTMRFGKKHVLLGVLFPIAANVLVIPPVLIYFYDFTEAWWVIYLSIFAGEVVSCGGLGYVLYRVIKKRFSHIDK